MSRLIVGAIALLVAFQLGRLSAQVAQEIEPSCVMCPATYISAAELREYEQVAVQAGLTDQQVRSLDIGKANVQIALVRRGELDAPPERSVAEHDLVTEVYYVISGSGTNVTGPDLLEKERRRSDNRAVRFLNGPGNNAAAIRNGISHELRAGDVLVIPAGTGHQFTKIEDHITYLMVRVDPDKVLPLLDATSSRQYLQEARR